jgi:hypothetical protein
MALYRLTKKARRAGAGSATSEPKEMEWMRVGLLLELR